MQTRVSKSYFSKFQGFTNVSNTFINIIFIEVAERHAAIIFSPVITESLPAFSSRKWPA